MAREIKFRIWSKEGPAMLEWDKILKAPDIADLLQHNFEDGYYSAPMQYTGLQDKNGREIYEADIVRLENASGFHMFAKVIFTDGCFDMLFTEPLWDRFGNAYRRRDYVKCYAVNHAIEVVGNIFEHPDCWPGGGGLIE